MLISGLEIVLEVRIDCLAKRGYVNAHMGNILLDHERMKLLRSIVQGN